MMPNPAPHPIRAAFARRTQIILAHRWWPLLAGLLAILLTLPSLRAGLAGDDYFHRAVLAGTTSSFKAFVHSPRDMFRFFDGDPVRTRQMMDFGFIPWWTEPQIKAAFWRPLTVLTHQLDYALWPESPAWMHLQSVLWYGGLAAAVAGLYRRLMPVAWIAGLAGFLYAVDHVHGMAIGFLANRNALLAAFFGVLALSAHDRWRRAGWRAGALAGPLLFTLSLLAKEGGIATCAYLAAYALILDRGTWRIRLLTLVPYIVITIVWRVVWTQLGFGVAHSALYIDPLADPARFIAALADRVPRLLLGQWALPPTETYLVVGPVGAAWQWRAAVAFIVLLAYLLTPLLRHDRLARFWALGMLLALLPICAAFPADRLLFFVGLGAMGLLAHLLTGVFGRAEWCPRHWAWRGPALLAGAVFVLIHVVLAPPALALRAAYSVGSPKTLKPLTHFVTPLDESVTQQDLILVNPPSVLHVAYLFAERQIAGQPVPRRIRLLASGFEPVRVQRPAARTLVVRPHAGYAAWIFEQLFRDPQTPARIGQRIELTNVTVEVTAVTSDGRPAEAAFHFDLPLDDPSLRWVCWKAGGFVPFTPPAIGESLDLPAPPMPF